MKTQQKLAIFKVDQQQFAIHLNHISRIERIVYIKPLPNTPYYIIGTINYHGQFIPVVNLRPLFELSSKKIELNDQLVIINTLNKQVDKKKRIDKNKSERIFGKYISNLILYEW